MIKNFSYFILVWTLFFTAVVQAQDVNTADKMDNLVVETTDGELIHLRIPILDNNEIVEQLPNLCSKAEPKEIYKFTNLTPHTTLVTYKSTTPFLHKGHELKSGRCLYINNSYFEHLTILWGLELLCGSEAGIKQQSPCQPADYILALIPQQTIFMDTMLEVSTLRGYYKFSQVKTIYNGEPEGLVLLHKNTESDEECEVF